jgi:TolB-like protein/DNA-binding SARP family transcriptional activator/Flp pilus assembly protein TadD
LLALLADAGEAGISRDRALGLLWPEVSQQRARHSLDQLLYALRGDLGPEAVASGSALVLCSEAVTCDLWDFEAAVKQKDWPAAISAYGGPFLDGFFAGACEQFDQWADARRAALARQWQHALESLATQAMAAGEAAAALGWWTRLATADSLNSRYALGLMKAMAATGDSVGALRHASVHAALVAEDLGVEPDSSVQHYADQLRTGGHARQAIDAAAPDRVVDTPPKPALPRSRLQRGRLRVAAISTILAVAGIAAGSGLLQRELSDVAGAEPSVRSLAVLPFADFSGTAQPYLGDALSDELINLLSKVPGLDVVGRTSSFGFKGSNAAVGEIGRQLGAVHVLEGSVQHANGRLRVSTRLVSAKTGYQLWADSYDVPAADIFEVQTRIARGIAAALQITLASGGAASPTKNLDAYDLYLRGRTIYLTAGVREGESTQRALGYFSRAAALDPQFAAVHAGLADVYSRLGNVEQARASAMEALRLDSTLAEAHASLAYIQAYYDRNWTGALRGLERAIRLSPGYAPAYLRRSNMLAARGEFDAAHADIERAQHVDPLSRSVRNNEALIYFWAGRYAEALPRLQALLAEDSSSESVRLVLALTYSGLGRAQEAAVEFRRSGKLLLAALPGADRGRLDSLRLSLESQAERSARDPKRMSDVALAAAYAQLGMNDRAIALLEQMLAPPTPANMVFLIWWPQFRPLHSDPAFDRIRRSVFVR